MEVTKDMNELQVLLREKDAELYALTQLLKNRELEIEQLRSKLHQYQSIIQLSSQPFSKVRAYGISAESCKAGTNDVYSLQELELAKFFKSDRLTWKKIFDLV